MANVYIKRSAIYEISDNIELVHDQPFFLLQMTIFFMMTFLIYSNKAINCILQYFWFLVFENT